MGSFLWWGIGALVVSIPIIIHLLHRQRTQPVLWGAMIFLRMSILQQKRRKRVEHWLLMLLRLALLALLVVLLGNLILPSDIARKFYVLGKVGGGRPASDVAIIVDHSLSTQWLSGDKPVYQQEIAAIAGLAQQDVLKQGDTVTVVLAEKTPRVLCQAEEYDKLGQWIERLKTEKPGSTRCSIPAAVQAAREVLNARGKNYSKRIVVVSDSQRDNWEAGGNPDQWAAAVGTRLPGVEPALRVYSVPVKAGEQRSNLAVENLEINRDSIGIVRPAGVNRPVEIRAVVRNTGTTAMAGATATLWVDGEQVKSNGSPVQVAVRPLPSRDPKNPNATDFFQPVSFSYAFPKAKSYWVEVRIDIAGDGFPVDNVTTGSVQVYEPMQVLFIDHKSGDPVDSRQVTEADSPRESKYPGSYWLLEAMLADAPNIKAPPLLTGTVISELDLEHLRGLAKGGATVPVRAPGGKEHTERRTLDDYAAVVINDVSDIEPTFMSKLRDYVDAGHGVWIILGEATRPQFLRNQISGSGLFPLVVPDAPITLEKPASVEIADPQYDVLRKRQNASRNFFSEMTVQRYWPITPAEDGAAKLTVPGGGMLILDRKPPTANDGRVVIWTSSISGEGGWNNFVTNQGDFFDAVNRTLSQLTAGVTKTQQSAQVKAGGRIVWYSPPLRDPTDAPAGSPRYMLFPGNVRAAPLHTAELIMPSGEKAPSARVESNNSRQSVFFNDLTPEPGKYELRFPEQPGVPPAYYGVGIDQREMDPEPLSAQDLKWLTAEDHQFVEKTLDPSELKVALLAASDPGMKVWPYLAGVLLAFLLLETYLTYRMVRRQTGPSDVAATIPGAPVAQAA
jgi:hypothetical protein